MIGLLLVFLAVSAQEKAEEESDFSFACPDCAFWFSGAAVTHCVVRARMKGKRIRFIWVSLQAVIDPSLRSGWHSRGAWHSRGV